MTSDHWKMLERAGYRTGQVLTRNVWRQMLGIGLVGIAALSVMGLRPRSLDDLVPLTIFVSMALLGLFAVVRWHVTRPAIVFEEDGLRVDGVIVGWHRVRRIEIGWWMLRVDVEDERGRIDSYEAVRASRAPGSRWTDEA